MINSTRVYNLDIFSTRIIKGQEATTLTSHGQEQELDVLLKGSIKARRCSNDDGGKWLTAEDGIERRPMVYVVARH